MENYRYTAKDEKGKSVYGMMKARDEVDLQAKLKAQGQFLVDIKGDTKKRGSFKKMRSDKLADFSRNLGKLLKAGVTLVRALRIVAEDEAIKPAEKKTFDQLQKEVRSGTPFSDALANQGDTFPLLFINMIRSAENTGGLDTICDQMAEYYDKEYRLQQKVKSAMVYPKILTVLIIGVVAIIMGFVIPQFKTLFDQMESLPVSTTILLAISNFVKNRWYVIIFVAFVLYMAIRILKTFPAIRMLFARLELHAPVFGKLKKVIYTARFSRTLSSLYSAGIPIVTCLTIAKTTIGNAYIEKQFDDMIANVRSGATLSEGIGKIDGFVKKLSSTIGVGEETGALDSMLTSIADQMDYDSEMATQRLVALLEPAMIVIMAVVVGFVIISVITPIYGSYQAISNSAG